MIQWNGSTQTIEEALVDATALLVKSRARPVHARMSTTSLSAFASYIGFSRHSISSAEHSSGVFARCGIWALLRDGSAEMWTPRGVIRITDGLDVERTARFFDENGVAIGEASLSA